MNFPQILQMKANPDPPPCWGGLLIFVFPVVIVFSMLVQCFITAWRIDHRQRAQSRRRHMHHRASSRPRETREEARQRKYRYLYQVRTARGDIISQVCQTKFHYAKLQSTEQFYSNVFFSLSLDFDSAELCVGLAKACSARISTAIRAFNQNQFTRTKYTKQRSHTFHEYTRRF